MSSTIPSSINPSDEEFDLNEGEAEPGSEFALDDDDVGEASENILSEQKDFYIKPIKQNWEGLKNIILKNLKNCDS